VKQATQILVVALVLVLMAQHLQADHRVDRELSL
jgi:hypothetical protein